MLIGDTEVDVDKYVSKERHELIASLMNMKQLHLNYLNSRTNYKIKYEMYVHFLFVFK